jgi:DNA replication protein DnaC
MLKCDVCGEPLEFEPIHFGDKEVRIHRQCACERKAAAEREEEAERARKAEKAKDIVYDGYLNKKFVEGEWKDDDKSNKKISESLLRYCKDWDVMKEKNIGVYLFGNTGSGKTFYASCIANYVRKKVNDYVLIGTSSQMVHEMVDDFGKGRKLMEYKISHYPLMVIDDLGTENASEYNMSTIEQIVDLRLSARKPLIITSNYAPKDLYADEGLLAERVKSRLSEMCVPMAVVKDDRRKDKVYKK